jgi:tetratricopeptide (TPR) repeat protein
MTDDSRLGALAAARKALEKDDLAGAIRHVASALGEDPNCAEALSLLGEVIALTPDPIGLISADEMATSSSLGAVFAYILAEEERIPEAIHQLLEVIGSCPDVLYIDWALGWLQRPEAAGRLDMEKLTAFIGSLIEQFPALSAPHGGGRETLSRIPLFIQMVRRTQQPEAHFLMAGVALLNRLGNLDEALKLAREAHALEPGSATATALAGTHASRNELDQALKVYQETLEREPADITTRLNMADLLVHKGQFQEAQELYAAVLEHEPEQEIAKPSIYFLRFVSGAGEDWRDKLLDLAEEQPENERAQRLSQQVTPYLGYLPDPVDVMSHLRPAGEGESAKSALALPWLEAPSNILAFDWLKKMDMTVARMQTPDPRLPRGWVDYLLWKYDDIRPRVAVAPPAPEVSQTVAEIAAQPFRLDAWWVMARRLAQHLGPEKVDDLLAAMVYPLGVAQVDRPAQWVYRVQIAAALVIAQLDDGWENSVRKKALLSLANGPMDWTVDAALVALAALAREEDDAAEDIARLFHALGEGAENGFSFHPALLWCSLRLPNLAEEKRTGLRDRLRHWQNDREAQQHFRQAMAFADKGELDKALEGLTHTLRLNPGRADAFRERALLLTRQGKMREAVDDFTQALQLEPGMPAVHLARGQANLKLGQFEQAIADFTEAARLTPWDWQPWYRRGLAHAARRELEKAVADFTEVIRLAPDLPEAYQQRAIAFTQLGQVHRAIGDTSEQIRLLPQSALAYNTRARLFARQGNHGAAIADHLHASELDPGNANTHSQLAWIWATCPTPALRDGRRAIQAAQKACELTGWKKAHILDVLAAAQAECGLFEEAVKSAGKAVELAPQAEKPDYLRRLESYRNGQAWRGG